MSFSTKSSGDADFRLKDFGMQDRYRTYIDERVSDCMCISSFRLMCRLINTILASRPLDILLQHLVNRRSWRVYLV